MPLEVEVWQRVIKGQLFKSNAFLNTMKVADEYVNGKIVHIPQAGGPSDVVVNRNQYPAAAVRREDQLLTYECKEFTTDPRHITDREMRELSYSKVVSIVREDSGTLMEKVAEHVIYEIAKNITSAYKIATTGKNATATAPSGTGQRKIFTEADLRRARLVMNLANVPQEDRYLLIPSNMLDQLLSDEKLRYAFQQSINIREASLPRLYGFQIIERSSIAIVDGDLTIKAPDTAGATTDSECAIAYHTYSVERALGMIKPFLKENDPQYYGHVLSFLLRMGARANRMDGKGLVAIYGAAATT